MRLDELWQAAFATACDNVPALRRGELIRVFGDELRAVNVTP
jgi:hypothetical protein